jgi:exosome complex RNA-binding protein Rrp4
MTSNAQARQGLTNQIRGAIIAQIKQLPVPQAVHGVVTNHTTGPPSSLTVTLQGTSTEISGIRYFDSYTPTIGDTVVGHKVGTDYYVVGKFQE